MGVDPSPSPLDTIKLSEKVDAINIVSKKNWKMPFAGDSPFLVTKNAKSSFYLHIELKVEKGNRISPLSI